MSLLFDQALSLTVSCTGVEETEYKLVPDDDTTLGSVTFIARSGRMDLHDHFTPEQADEMSAMWAEVARRARVANGLVLDDATIERLARELIDPLTEDYSISIADDDRRRVEECADRLRATT